MDDYELFKFDVLSILADAAPDGALNLNTVVSMLDVVSERYTFQRKTTEIIVQSEEYPEILKVFLISKAVEEKSPKTLNLYKTILTNFFRITQKPFNQISTNEIRAFLFNYKQERNVKNSTLETMRRVLNTFYEWCCAENLLGKNPMRNISVIKTEQKKREPMRLIELEYVRNSCTTLREKALIDFLYSTGCRVSELCNVKIKNIDWSRKTVQIEHGKGDKTRTTYLNPECEVSLRAYLDSRKDDCEYLFTHEKGPKGKLSEKTVQNIVSKCTQRVRDNLSIKVTPHTFRHTAATVAIHNGMPIEQVQQFLGHKNINTTMIYAEVDNDDVRVSHNKYLS